MNKHTQSRSGHKEPCGAMDSTPALRLLQQMNPGLFGEPMFEQPMKSENGFATINATVQRLMFWLMLKCNEGLSRAEEPPLLQPEVNAQEPMFHIPQTERWLAKKQSRKQQSSLTLRDEVLRLVDDARRSRPKLRYDPFDPVENQKYMTNDPTSPYRHHPINQKRSRNAEIISDICLFFVQQALLHDPLYDILDEETLKLLGLDDHKIENIQEN
ncbi:unnamed protein product [Bursaphelenchus xylophilus]|uniref:(pine wood nematode) hypothetical protein n=1 Tax=Bursaphelenchus xylophilus TaxID=6326 RepID=A0A1I7RIV6_BURXY|nr:unnamed protein product [Bursaphelenchus xylophilus]CAG9119122.1 unnamed protein product [Bursaphelenchus xylophilus]